MPLPARRGAWAAPTKVSSTSEGATARIAVDGAGNAVALFALVKSSGFGDVYPLQAVSRPAGGAWGAPVTISGANDTVASPSVVATPLGTFTIAWVLSGWATQVDFAGSPDESVAEYPHQADPWYRQRKSTQPPSVASAELSPISCRRIRERLAPRAARTPISRVRDAPFASSRFATLAQVISSRRSAPA